MPSSFFSHPTGAIATLLILAPLASNAQTPASEGSNTLPTVTIEASADASAQGLTKPYAGGQVARGGRVGILGAQDMMATPFASTSYTSELIQDQQAQSVADVLRNAPSIRQARGFGNFQELYMVRGFPVYSDDVAYNGLYGMLPRQYIASEFFERVEVLLGPNAFLNGAAPGSSGSLGGSINLLPKRAPSEPLTRIGMGVQTGGQASVAADIARRFGPDQSTGIRFNAVRRDGGTGVDDEKRELSALALGLDWHSSTLRISADIGYQDHDLRAGRPNVAPAPGLPIPPAPDAQRNYAQPWTFAKEQDTFATARAEFDLTNSTTLWAASGIRDGSESNSLAGLNLVDAIGNSQSYRFDNERKDRITTAEIGARTTLHTGAVKHTLTASAAYFRSKERNAWAMSDSVIGNNLYAPAGSATPPPTIYHGGNLANPLLANENRASSLAIADTLAFAGDTVLLTVGARHQSIKQTSFDYDSGAQVSRYNKSRTTPVAGLVVKASPQLSFYGNYIEGLLKGDVAPGTANGLPVTNSGQVFAPYQAKQKEIGVKYDGGRLGASMALFTTSQPSAFVQDQTYGVYGEQRNRGLEFALYGEPTRGLRLLGGLTLLDAKQIRSPNGTTDGKHAIGVPKRQLNLGAEWDVPGITGLALNTRVLNTSRQYADAANMQAVPAWTRLDAGIRYLMDIGNGRMLTLRGRIDNLANKNYWASTGGYPGTGYLVLAAPRSVVLNASVDF